MSGESAQHIRLVGRLIGEIKARHASARNLMILADHRDFGTDRPEMMGGHLPDVFARDLPETFRVIGEAKTSLDLESDRSRRQIAAFLEDLSVYPNSSFCLAVPWAKFGRASAILKSLHNASLASVNIEIIRCE